MFVYVSDNPLPYCKSFLENIPIIFALYFKQKVQKCKFASSVAGKKIAAIYFQFTYKMRQIIITDATICERRHKIYLFKKF